MIELSLFFKAFWGSYAVILKNNVPRYLVIVFSKAEKEKVAGNEDVFAISERLIKQNAEAYKELSDVFLALAFGDVGEKEILQCIIKHQK